MSSWWSDYKKAFLNGINPVAGIGENLNLDFPAPTVAAPPPVPDRWWRPNEPHPLYPQGGEYGGAPPDFGGAVIPNPNNVRVLPDTRVPADPLVQGKTSMDNFRGKTPVQRAFTPLKNLLRQQ
jgi:hypothetical protein